MVESQGLKSRGESVGEVYPQCHLGQYVPDDIDSGGEVFRQKAIEIPHFRSRVNDPIVRTKFEVQQMKNKEHQGDESGDGHGRRSQGGPPSSGFFDIIALSPCRPILPNQHNRQGNMGEKNPRQQGFRHIDKAVAGEKMGVGIEGFGSHKDEAVAG